MFSVINSVCLVTPFTVQWYNPLPNMVYYDYTIWYNPLPYNGIPSTCFMFSVINSVCLVTPFTVQWYNPLLNKLRHIFIEWHTDLPSLDQLTIPGCYFDCSIDVELQMYGDSWLVFFVPSHSFALRKTSPRMSTCAKLSIIKIRAIEDQRFPVTLLATQMKISSRNSMHWAFRMSECQSVRQHSGFDIFSPLVPSLERWLVHWLRN